MPLHKSSRASRLDPTMISAPLGDFRHTMHIGRGGDAFGDTSFLSTLGPSSPKPDPASPGIVSSSYHSDLNADAPESPQNNELRHSDSVSSLNLDLDLDLGPSMLGDVLGVMDGLGLHSNQEVVETKQGKGAAAMSFHLWFLFFILLLFITFLIAALFLLFVLLCSMKVIHAHDQKSAKKQKTIN
uniref:CDC42 effector protein (Rho GTPase binding) 5 n=1 Tax=Haplochromis burtoni TaxID=8153 RepID=A0A3Q3C236_HAPBU